LILVWHDYLDHLKKHDLFRHQRGEHAAQLMTGMIFDGPRRIAVVRGGVLIAPAVVPRLLCNLSSGVVFQFSWFLHDLLPARQPDVA